MSEVLGTGQAARLLGVDRSALAGWLHRYGPLDLYPKFGGRRVIDRDRLPALANDIAKHGLPSMGVHAR